MKNGLKLRNAMFMLQFSAYDGIKKEIISRCLINEQIFRNWNSGRTEIPERYYATINEIFGKDIFNE